MIPFGYRFPLARNLAAAAGIVWLCSGSMTACAVPAHSDVAGDERSRSIASIYGSYGLTGSFAFQRSSDTALSVINPGLMGSGRLPCSTFKIPNSLIALEERAVRDEHEMMKWDGIVREIAAWNADQNLQSAYRNSTVWFYQALARRMGMAVYQTWLQRLAYGNGDLSAGLDRFWLEGPFTVTHEEQIRILRGIGEGTLPVSSRSINILKSIMVMDKSDTHGGGILRAKTGMCREPETGHPTGWLVGYTERAGERFYFSSFVTADVEGQDFARRRVEASRKVLSFLGAW